MLIHLDFIKCRGRKTESDMCAQTAFLGPEADLKTLTSKFVTFDLKFCHKTEKTGDKICYFMFVSYFYRNAIAHH